MNVSAADIKAHLTTVARNGHTGVCLVRCVNPACADWAPEVGTYEGAWDVAFEHREIMSQNEAMVDDMTAPSALVEDREVAHVEAWREGEYRATLAAARGAVARGALHFGSDFDCCTAPVVIA